jgi:hypothetical protein
MQKLFDVLIRCTDKRLPTILQACDGALELQWVKASEVEAPPKTRAQQLHKQMNYVNGKRNKGISGAELAIELLTKAGGIVSYDKLAAGFAARGFAGNSVSPVLSQLRQIGVVDMPQRGTWKLTAKKAPT